MHSSTNANQSFSYINIPGAVGIPSYEDFKKEGTYFQRNCDNFTQPKIGLNSSSVTGTDYHFQYIEIDRDERNFTVVSCHQKIQNCALCSSYEPFGCRICIDGFSLNTYSDV